MMTMRRWIVPVLLVFATLITVAGSANAQEFRGRNYIGVYRRRIPGRYGDIRVEMDVLRERHVQIVTTFPDGATKVEDGEWSIGQGQLNVTTRSHRDVGLITRIYTLKGRNLELVGDPHIFYKKQ